VVVRPFTDFRERREISNADRMREGKMWEAAAQDLKKYIVEQILDGRDGNELDFQTPLLEWGIIDSLTIVDIVVFVKDRFAIDLPASELVPENLESITALTALMERHRSSVAE
jgi:acyl carrier protein